MSKEIKKMVDDPYGTIENKQKMIEALEKSLGIVTSASRLAGIRRETHYHWLRSDKEYKARVKEIENVALDFAETQLHKQIAKGNPLSTIFYLKCKAKKRGYIEQHNLEIKGNMKFTAEFGKSDTIHTTSESGEDTLLDQ
jgi:hypothetical protein